MSAMSLPAVLEFRNAARVLALLHLTANFRKLLTLNEKHALWRSHSNSSVSAADGGAVDDRHVL